MFKNVLRSPIRSPIWSVVPMYGDIWTPAQLFSDGQQGVWYEPKPQYLFQDAAGTVPVTADGDPVGMMVDLSGNGNHATQSTSAARPVYRTDGVLHWLQFDGVDDWLSVPVYRQDFIDSGLTLAAKSISTDGTDSVHRVVTADNQSLKISGRSASNWWLEFGRNTTQNHIGFVQSNPIAAKRAAVAGLGDLISLASIAIDSEVVVKNSALSSASESIVSVPRDTGGGVDTFYQSELYSLVVVYSLVPDKEQQIVSYLGGL